MMRVTVSLPPTPANIELAERAKRCEAVDPFVGDRCTKPDDGHRIHDMSPMPLALCPSRSAIGNVPCALRAGHQFRSDAPRPDHENAGILWRDPPSPVIGDPDDASPCPKCGRWVPGTHDLGVLYDPKPDGCGWCSHASIDGNVCGLCKTVIP